MIRNRLLGLAGMLIASSAINHLVRRREWRQKLENEPESKLKTVSEYLATHPLVNTLVSAGELALGVMLVRRAREEVRETS